jgi:fructose/tagatose bisphosphate aldolase
MSNREIIVHSLDHALAALAAAAALKLPVTLASARGAALQAGPAWFKAVIDEARATHPDVDVIAILDCGDEPGAVMAALRTGLTQLRFSGSETVRGKLAAMGAEFAASADATLDLLDVREPEAVCRVFLAGH